MSLVTRQIGPDAKGSKLTFADMDNNLYYLQSLGVSGMTYSASTLTLINPTGGTITVNIASDTNTFLTAATYNNTTNTITLTDNTNTDFDIYLDSVSGLTVNGSLSATTLYGDGSNLTGLQEVFVTGGTYSSGTTIFTNNTGGTFNVTGYFTPNDDIYTTGLTFNLSNYDLSIDRNDGTSFTQSLSILASDLTVTGGTYDPNSGNATFTNNTGGTFTVGGFLTGFTDLYVTGFTYNNNTFTISQNSGSSLNVLLDTVTGFTVNGGLFANIISAETITNNYSITSSDGTSYIGMWGGGYLHIGNSGDTYSNSGLDLDNDYFALFGAGWGPAYEGGRNINKDYYLSQYAGNLGITIVDGNGNFNGRGILISNNSTGTTTTGSYPNLGSSIFILAPNSSILQSSINSVIVGGGNNTIKNNNSETSIISSKDSTISVGNLRSSIFSSFRSSIEDSTQNCSVVGGDKNLIESNVINSTVIGGDNNEIYSGTSSSGIFAGNNNIIQQDSTYSAIIGGSNNVLDAYGSVILGGQGITATTSFTTYVPNLNIVSSLLNDDSLTQVLVKDTNGSIKYRSASSLSGTSTVGAVSANTSTIHFTGNTVFGTFSSPLSTNITDNLTGAKLGITQKIYHNSGSAPTVPAGWVLLGSTTYLTSNLNIIYAEWSEGSRVEYWIVR